MSVLRLSRIFLNPRISLKLSSTLNRNISNSINPPFFECTKTPTSQKMRTMDIRSCCSGVSSGLREDLLCKVADVTKEGIDKVTVVGAGSVGISCVNAILFQKISSHVALVDAFPKKLEGEGMDFSHGSVFLDDPRIEYDTDLCISSNSKVVIIAAGARQENNESRLDLVHKNVQIIKNIMPSLMENSPNAVYLIASNPVDIISWATWQVGLLPINKIIGVGCHLDTARFRCLIGQRLGVAPKAVDGYIIGEHGDSQVPLWSGVHVGGVLLRDILPDIGLEMDEQGWTDLMKSVVRAGSVVRCLKGYSNTAVGLAAADITKAVLNNSQTIKSVSTFAQGHYDICHEIFLSLPCTIGNNGVTQVIRMRMTAYEKKLLQNSANIIYNIQKSIKVP